MDALVQLEGTEAQTRGANLTHVSYQIRLHLPRLLACPEECAALCRLILERIAMKITGRRLGGARPSAKARSRETPPEPGLQVIDRTME